MAFDNVFMRLRAVLSADIDDLQRGFADARREASETAAYIDRQKGTAEFDAKIAEFERKADYVEARMKEIDSLDAEPEVKLRATKELERQSQSIERSMARLKDQRALRELGGDADYAAPRMRKLGDETRRTNRDTDRAGKAFGSFGKQLSDVRIQLGFASLNVKQLGAAMVFLSPILSGLIGTASALIGTVGSGLAGALAVGGAGFTGFALAALGMVGAVSGADKRLKAMSKDWKGLLEDFQGKTGAARTGFFDAMASGLERAKALMPTFAAETNKVGKAFSSMADNFLSAFNSGEMKQTISTVMSAFSGAMPELGSALGNIAEGLMNIFASASRYIQPITNAISQWARGFADATSQGSKLDSTIDGMMDSAESVVHFLAAAGRLMVTFFGSGADEGAGLFDDMTAALDNWNAALSTSAGQDSLNSWFASSINTVKELWDVLEQGIQLLGTFADAFEPISNGAMMVLEIIGKIVNLLASTPGGGLLLTALGGAAGLSMAASLVGKIAEGLKLLGGGALLSRLGVGAAAGGGTAATGGLIGRLLTGGMAVGSLAPLLFNPITGGIVAIGAAVYGLNKLLGTDENPLQNMADAMKTAAENQARWTETIAQNESALRGNRSGINGLRQSILDTIPAIEKGGKAGKTAFIGLKDSIQQARQPLVEQQRSFKDWADQIEQNSPSLALLDQFHEGEPLWESILAKIKRTGEVSKQTADQLRSMGVTSEGIQKIRDELGDMGSNADRARRQVAALDKQLIDATRARAGKDPLGIGTESVQRLSNMLGRQKAIKLLVDIDSSKAAGKIAGLARDLQQLGARKQAIEILANTDGAQAKIKALEQLKEHAKNPLKFAINAVDKATSVAKGAKRSIDAIGNKHDTDIRGKDNASGPAKQAKGAVESIPRDHDTNIRADASAALATARAAAAAISGMTAVLHVIAAVSGMPSGGRATGGPLVPERGEIPGYARGGGYIRRPMFMVGEEAPRHPEFVIATNPAYRDENRKYLFEAAHRLGLPGFAKGGITKPYQMGSIPEQKVQREYDQTRSAYQKTKTKLSSLQDKKDEKGRKGDPSPGAINAARAQLRADEARMNFARRQLRAVKDANKNISKYGDQISRDSSEMALWQERGNTDKFNRWKGDKIHDINTLLGALKRQAKFAHGTFETQIRDRIAQLRTEKATTQRQTAGSNALLTGGETEGLNDVNKDIALARLTASDADDTAANDKLQAFWQGVLNRLQRQHAGPELIAQAANNLADARGDGSSAAGAGGVVSDADSYLTARSELYRSFGGNAIMGRSILPSQSPFAGGAPGGGGSSTVNQTLNFVETPNDPHGWANQAAWEAQAAMA